MSLANTERAELIALRELRDAISDLATNRGKHWTRPGSREHDEQYGEQNAFKRVLQMIDGRMNGAGKSGRLHEGASAGAGQSHVLGGEEVPEALVPPAEVV